jgi:hypothetical protein
LEAEGSECWEKKASNEVETRHEESLASLPNDTVFSMLGLSQSDLQGSGEAWESKSGAI